jgi:hypothetical protein
MIGAFSVVAAAAITHISIDYVAPQERHSFDPMAGLASVLNQITTTITVGNARLQLHCLLTVHATEQIDRRTVVVACS